MILPSSSKVMTSMACTTKPPESSSTGTGGLRRGRRAPGRSASPTHQRPAASVEGADVVLPGADIGAHRILDGAVVGEERHQGVDVLVAEQRDVRLAGLSSWALVSSGKGDSPVRRHPVAEWWCYRCWPRLRDGRGRWLSRASKYRNGSPSWSSASSSSRVRRLLSTRWASQNPQSSVQPGSPRPSGAVRSPCRHRSVAVPLRRHPSERRRAPCRSANRAPAVAVTPRADGAVQVALVGEQVGEEQACARQEVGQGIVIAGPPTSEVGDRTLPRARPPGRGATGSGPHRP